MFFKIFSLDTSLFKWHTPLALWASKHRFVIYSLQSGHFLVLLPQIFVCSLSLSIAISYSQNLHFTGLLSQYYLWSFIINFSEEKSLQYSHSTYISLESHSKLWFESLLRLAERFLVKTQDNINKMKSSTYYRMEVRLMLISFTFKNYFLTQFT